MASKTQKSYARAYRREGDAAIGVRGGCQQDCPDEDGDHRRWPALGRPRRPLELLASGDDQAGPNLEVSTQGQNLKPAHVRNHKLRVA